MKLQRLERAGDASAARAALWASVDRILETMDVPSVVAHQLGPLAARRWRELGRPVPYDLQEQERAAQLRALMAVPVLARARAAYEGRMLIMKGAEIEVRYPAGGRLFGDLDLLVDDAPAARDALLASGFEEVPNALDRHPIHLAAVGWPQSQILVEVHMRPNWPRHLHAPPNAELFDAAVPSALPVKGLEAPAPAHHVLLVAAHHWKDMPLSSVRDLLDVAVLADGPDAREIEGVARRWELTRLWRTTLAAVQWLFEGQRPPLASRLWARNLLRLREPVILEKHLRRWVAPFWMLSPPRALVASIKNIGMDARPVGGETWAAKVRRVGWVATHPTRTRSQELPGLGEQDEEWL
jgi:putative nucleotidyltransferase-like protein